MFQDQLEALILVTFEKDILLALTDDLITRGLAVLF